MHWVYLHSTDKALQIILLLICLIIKDNNSTVTRYNDQSINQSNSKSINVLICFRQLLAEKLDPANFKTLEVGFLKELMTTKKPGTLRSYINSL